MKPLFLALFLVIGLGAPAKAWWKNGYLPACENGHVLALQSTGRQMLDKTQKERGELIKLPDERNGLAMVFRPFDRVSYALVMQIDDPVQVGDKLINPK